MRVFTGMLATCLLFTGSGNAFAKGDWGGVAKAVTDEMIDRFSISGNPEEVIERIKELSKQFKIPEKTIYRWVKTKT